MGREIKLCLVYRDMWQSSGKYMPRVDQLVRVAEPIIDMGCFARVETNGGGFEQINLLYGENPNRSVRAWTTPFNEAGIQTQMLERGLNGIRMSPVPADVRKLMFKVKKKQGTDIARSFDGLNYAPNLENSFTFAREAGMIAQACLCITYSKLHTVDYFVKLADQLVELGAEEICLKDMAGVGRPVSIGKIVKGIRERHPDILIQYHGHSTPGFSIVSSLEAARNGADIIDVGMEPLSWGTGHADLLTVHAMLKDAGFTLPDINMKAYMQARSLSQEFMDDFLGYYINQRNRYMNSLLIGPGLPGGMMGSLMADLEKNVQSLNKWLTKRDKESVDQEQLLIKLFDEVEYIWPKLGYPPLVTPYSQYVKNTALMNVLQMIKGRERWSMIDENTWNMLIGKAGKLPGPLGEEILAIANKQDREFFYGNPQDLYPDELELFAGKMEEKGWDFGEDDEELMEYAMHPPQYEDYKSGKAKERFLEDLEKRKAAKNGHSSVATPAASGTAAPTPKQMRVTVDGQAYEVSIDYPQSNEAGSQTAKTESSPKSPDTSGGEGILSPLEGKFFLTKDNSEEAIKVGDKISSGQTIGYIEAMKVYNAVAADKSGTVEAIVAKVGEEVEEDDVLIKIK
ncbi:MAG: oxaloacetate decarboxylase [Bacteroidetes bacterium]|nr:oxaloacetate decarboxylase [Bacteroidota bacterium]